MKTLESTIASMTTFKAETKADGEYLERIGKLSGFYGYHFYCTVGAFGNTVFETASFSKDFLSKHDVWKNYE